MRGAPATSLETTTGPSPTSKSVHANGIDIHYVEVGDGEPLVLLHGGLVSTNPIWDAFPFSHGAHLANSRPSVPRDRP